MPPPPPDELPGRHLCSICESQMHAEAEAVSFLRSGLSQQTRCLYVADADPLRRLREELQLQAEIVPALESRALVLVSLDDLSFKHDGFDPYRLYAFLKGAARDAGRDGFAGLHVAIDMNWLRTSNVTKEQRRELEHLLTDLAEAGRCTWLCQHLRQRFSAGELVEAVRMHPGVLHAGITCSNPHYLPEGSATDAPARLDAFRTQFAVQAELRRARASAEEALHAAQVELARVSRMTALGEFAATIAHEVRQPLTGIITEANAAIRWLTRPEPNLSEARAALLRIVEGGNRANDVIVRVQALLRNEPRADDVFSMNDAIRQMAGLMQSELESNHIVLRLELDQDLPAIRGNRVQLEQVMLNLFVNAIEAINARRSPEREIVVRTGSEDRNSIHVAVRDSGIGLSDDVQQKIFQSFFTTKPQGMGIGLSISRSIIDAHEGSIWAVRNGPSEPGATFHFILPARGAADG